MQAIFISRMFPPNILSILIPYGSFFTDEPSHQPGNDHSGCGDPTAFQETKRFAGTDFLTVREHSKAPTLAITFPSLVVENGEGLAVVGHTVETEIIPDIVG